MKPTSLKLIALILSLAVLLQGCKVYYKNPVSLDKAVQEATSVKVTTNYDDVMLFKKVLLKDGKYFGLKSLKRSSENILLTEGSIKKIKLYNGTMTGILNTVIIPGAIIGLFLSSFSFQF